MNVYRNTKSILAAHASNMGTELGTLIRQCINELSDYELADLSEIVKIIVLQPSDPLEHVDSELGFVLLDRDCDLAARHRQWFELTLVTDDTGSGAIVYVPRHPKTNLSLRRYCVSQWRRLHSGPAREF